MLRKTLLPLIIIAVAVLTFFLLKVSEPETAARDQPQKAWLVDAVTVQHQRLAPEITIYGRVETPRDASLKAALEADIETIDVLEGDIVDAGQTLITLDDTDVSLLRDQRQADVREAQALIDSENQRYQRDRGLLSNQQQLVNLADKAVQRAKKLEETRLASQSALDESLAAYQQQLLSLKQLQHDIDTHPARLAQLEAAKSRAQALLAQSEVNLGRTRITAPFDSRVAGLNVAPGDRVRPGDTLLTVYDLSNLEVRAQIPGRFIGRVRTLLNQGKRLQAHARLEGKTIQLTLQRLSGEVRQDSGGIDGLFSIDNNQEPLPLGTFMELQLRLAEQDDVIEIPFSALYGLDRVYRIEAGLLQSVQVERVGEKTGENGQKLMLIRSDKLQPGDKVAATQLPNAITGLRVEIAE
ncbi:efflux RND transporter periplasmic adaptor subunit [uncultured Methylophaga sp.]|uniref:efflux RND transporter periplasmic adaptor subunit n=1 Tax=uncultured Methylophaga sp. TaxID=285271 RepID=UPI00260E361D|nr:efflux RND transporter periplasmic adaptor subunit [uncultured Methylophaga sp.]